MGASPIDFGPLGVAVGHAQDEEGATGCTVIRGVDRPLRGGVVVLGRATGTRELHTLDPAHLAGRVDALLLTGGSAYGLDAAAGVMRWCEERGRGVDVGTGVVPIVPAAVVFDLSPLGRFDARPDAAMAYSACDLAHSAGIAEGAVGAGTGATVGKGAGMERAMKGGVGLGLVSSGDVSVGAVAVVNAFGDVRDADGRIVAGARGEDGAWADTARLAAGGDAVRRFADVAARNTTISCVFTNAAPPRGELAQLASAATAAYHRRITPCGTSWDGDVVFALGALEGPEAPLMTLEALAVLALEEAIERAVRLARGRAGLPGCADRSS